MASKNFLNSHRQSYMNAVGLLESDGQYVVNSEMRAAKENKKNIRMAQSYCWSEIPINASTSSYVFQVIENIYNAGNTGLLPTENRIKLQDVFFTYALGFFLRPMENTVGNQAFAFNMLSFPSAFLSTNGFNCGIVQLLSLWNGGELNVKVNGDVLTPGWSMSQHLNINQTQYPQNVGAAPFNYYDQRNMGEDGFSIVEPNWIINGGNDNTYELQYGQNFSYAINGLNLAGGNKFNLVMYWQGFLAQNASSIMNNLPKKGF
jgi:hypothetical protein